MNQVQAKLQTKIRSELQIVVDLKAESRFQPQIAMTLGRWPRSRAETRLSVRADAAAIMRGRCEPPRSASLSRVRPARILDLHDPSMVAGKRSDGTVPRLLATFRCLMGTR